MLEKIKDLLEKWQKEFIKHDSEGYKYNCWYAAGKAEILKKNIEELEEVINAK